MLYITCYKSSDSPLTYQVNKNLIYKVSQYSIHCNGSLVDHGSNESIAGDDVCVLDTNNPPHHVNFRGINNHELTNIPIVTCAGVITTQKGPVTLIMN